MHASLLRLADSITVRMRFLPLLSAMFTCMTVFAQELPPLRGPYVPGMSVFNAVDSSRGDRTLRTLAWYPVDPVDAEGQPPLQYYVHYGPDDSLEWYYDSPFLGGVQEARVSQAGPFPLVVLAHGNFSWPQDFALMAESLASHGFIVVAPRITGNSWGTPDDAITTFVENRPKDMRFLLDLMTERNDDSADRFHGRIALDHVAMGGHSLGVYTATGAASGVAAIGLPPDPRVDALLPIDGYPFFANEDRFPQVYRDAQVITEAEVSALELPVLFVGGADPVGNIWTHQFSADNSAAFAHAPRFVGLDIRSAVHTSFLLALCQFKEQLEASGAPAEVWEVLGPESNWPCYSSVASPDEVQELQTAYTTAFLKAELLGDHAFESLLEPVLGSSPDAKLTLELNFAGARGGLDMARLLLTDPLGRQIGNDLLSGDAINDFADPRVSLGGRSGRLALQLPDDLVVPGEYLLEGIASATLPHDVELQIALGRREERGLAEYLGRDLLWSGPLSPGETLAPLRFRMVPVPEPSTLALACCALVGFLALRRKQRFGQEENVMRRPSVLSYATLLAATLSTAAAHGQVYYTGPYGPEGTWNVYEVAGLGNLTGDGRYLFTGGERIETGVASTWVDAHEAASARTFEYGGTTYAGHLLTLSGPIARSESDAAMSHSLVPNHVWIGLTDDEAYGGAEGGTGERQCGPPESRWVWVSGEPVDYTNWGGAQPNNGCIAGPYSGNQDAAILIGEGEWHDQGNGGPHNSSPRYAYVIEFETHLAEVPELPEFPVTNPRPSRTPGPQATSDGKMAIREIYRTGPLHNVVGALRSLFDPAGIVHDYESATLNISDLLERDPFGFNRNYGLIDHGLVAAGRLENVAVRAVGRFRVPAGEEGDYTFHVNARGGAELWIYDHQFQCDPPRSRGGPPDCSLISTYGSKSFPPYDSTLGVVTLTAGDYDFEFVGNNNIVGSLEGNIAFGSFELAAAKGAHREFDPNQFRLIGSPEVNIEGPTPRTSGPWQVVEVLRLPEFGDEDGPLNTFQQAIELLHNADGDDLVFNGARSVLNFVDPDSGSSTFFEHDVPFLNDENLGLDDNDFVLRASATLEITSAGEYTFGFAADEGGELTIAGASFSSVSSSVPAQIINDGQTLSALAPAALRYTLPTTGITFLEPGTYPIEFTMWERDGDASAEVFVSPAAVEEFAPDLFALLGDTSTMISVHRPGGLQLVAQGYGPVGDTDADGDVDLEDLNNVRNNFGQGGDGLAGDTNGDGTVDVADLNNVRNHFGETLAGPAAVPEPGGLGLAALALLLVGVVLNRRTICYST